MKSSGAIETRIVSHVLLFMLEFFKFSRVPSYEKTPLSRPPVILEEMAILDIALFSPGTGNDHGAGAICNPVLT